MKKFTFLFAGLCMTFMSVNGQFSKDVGVTALPSIYAGMTVYPNVPTTIQYTRENFGSTAITSADVDSFTMEILADGIKRQTFYRNMGAPFGVGATETTQGVAALDWGSLGLSAGNVSTCARTRLWKNGSLIDQDPSNDETCVVVSYSTTKFTYDVAPSNLQFSSPAYAPGSSLPIPSFPSEMTFDLSNEGSTDLPVGLPISFDLTIGGGAPANYTGNLTTSISAPGSATLTLNFSGSLPITAGPFEVCMEMTMPDDVNTSNDKTCSNYFMGGNSIEETEKVFGKMWYNSGVLRMEFNETASGMANVALFETSGRNVGNFDLNVDKSANHSIDLNQFGTGIYIANITVNNEVISYRFVIE